MIALNKLVQTLRQGMREATGGQAEPAKGDVAD
jgi:hypothetical protein